MTEYISLSDVCKRVKVRGALEPKLEECADLEDELLNESEDA